jgi:hypothetical protein
MKKKVMILLFVVILALTVMGAAVVPTIWLKANQTVTVRCVDPSGEIQVEFAGDDEALVTCRVWVDR